MATYIFVHGAFQGGWVWGKVASILRWEKHQVYTPTLTGCGDRSHLLNESIDLHTYIKDITNFLHCENLNGVVLVSHGYSGMVTSAVVQAMPHVARKVVYLDAAVPEQGKSFLDLAGDGFRHVLGIHRLNDWLVKPWPAVSFGISRATDKQWFESRLVNFPLAAFTTPFPGRFDGSLFDISFIHCQNGSNGSAGITADDAKHRGWAYHELESGPLPMVTTPQELADLLAAIGS